MLMNLLYIVSDHKTFDKTFTFIKKYTLKIFTKGSVNSEESNIAFDIL